MKRSSPTRQRLAAIALLGLPLLTFPMLGLVGGWLAAADASIAADGFVLEAAEILNASIMDASIKPLS